LKSALLPKFILKSLLSHQLIAIAIRHFISNNMKTFFFTLSDATQTVASFPFHFLFSLKFHHPLSPTAEIIERQAYAGFIQRQTTFKTKFKFVLTVLVKEVF